MRIFIAGIATLAVLAGCVGTVQGPPGERLPDLDQALPGAVSIETRNGRRVLVFSSAVDNVGAGPLVIRGSRRSRAVATMLIRQVVTRTDGSRAVYTLPGRLRYVRSETHSHWHLLRLRALRAPARLGRSPRGARPEDGFLPRRPLPDHASTHFCA